MACGNHVDICCALRRSDMGSAEAWLVAILGVLDCMLRASRTCNVIFGQVLPRLILGTLYVVPLAFIESLLLFVYRWKPHVKIALWFITSF
jgi:hypothetical protein